MLDLDNLVLEDLQCQGLKIYQGKKGYRFTSDSVALANFVKVKKKGILLDLCSGSGVVGILASAKNVVSETIFVEIQENLANMCKLTIDYNKLNNMQVINQDLHGVHKLLKDKNIDTIVCNPPYFRINDNPICDLDEIAIARHEIKVTLEDIVKESSLILKDGGKLYMSIKSTRLADLIYLMKKYSIEPKELKIITENKNDQAVLIKGIKKGEVGLKLQL